MSEAVTMTLTEFLLARIVEDEASAKAADWGPRWTMEHDLPNTQVDIRAHIIKHSPSRVLAECEAKRRIVERISGEMLHPYSEWTEVILCDLALPYADHAEFREEWRA